MSTPADTRTSEPAFPYPGLRPFEPHESHLFFGRDEHVFEMFSLLEDHRFLAVVGASGSGKSSLVRAGLLPRLRDEGLLNQADGAWRFLIMRPGDSPLDALADACHRQERVTGTTLAQGLLHGGDPLMTRVMLESGPKGLVRVLADARVPDNDNVLLLVDQFEEVFRFAGLDAPAASAPTSPGARPTAVTSQRRNESLQFVALLLETARQTERPVHVVLTMRTDFIGDCDQFDGLPEAISAGQFLTPRLSWRQLEQAITGPLELPGFESRIDRAIVDQMLNAASNERDALPLVQHALLRMWLAAASDAQDLAVSESTPTLRHITETEHYLPIGGLSHALDLHATDLYESLTPGRKRIAEGLFRRLAERSPKGQLVRRLTSVQEVAEVAGVTPDEVIAVVDVFRQPGVNFLVTSPAGTLTAATSIDVSHESLLRQWRVLQTWIEEESEAAAGYRRLIDAVDQKEQVIDGIRLDLAVKWRDTVQPTAAWAARYDGAEQAQDSRLAECLQLIKDSLAAREARQQAAERDRLEREQAQARELGLAQKLAAVQTGRAATFRRMLWLVGFAAAAAVLLAVFAWFKSAEAENARAKARDNEQEAIEKQKEAEEQAKRADKATRQYFEGIGNSYWRDATAARDDQRHTLKAVGLCYRAAKAFEQADDLTRARNARSAADQLSQDLVTTFFHDGSVNGAVFDSTQSRVLTFSDDDTAKLWDASNGALLRTFQHDDEVRGGIFLDDDSRVLTWSEDGTARVWRIDNTREKETIFTHSRDDYQGQAFRVSGTSLNADESRLLTWSNDGTARLWDVLTGKNLYIFNHDDGETRERPFYLNGAQFSSDQSLVLTWGADGTARLWNAEDGGAIRTFKHEGTNRLGKPISVYDASLTRDASRLLTWTANGVAWVWNVLDGRILHQLRAGGSYVGNATFLQEETRIMTWSPNDEDVIIWDATTGEEERTLHCTDRVSRVTLTRDQSRLLIVNLDGTVSLRDVETGETKRTIRHAGVRYAEFLANESQVLTAGSDGYVHIWDVATATPIRTFCHDEGYAARLGVDESRVLTWGRDNKARLWRMTACNTRTIYKHGDRARGAVFSMDLSRALSWGFDGTARISHVTGKRPQVVFDHRSRTATGSSYYMNAASFSTDESRVITCSDDGTARLWDASTGKSLRVFRHEGTDSDGNPLAVEGAILDSNASRVLTWSKDRLTRIWDVTTGETIQRFRHQEEKTAHGPPVLFSDDRVYGALFTRDELSVLTWSRNANGILWDVVSGRKLHTFKYSEEVPSDLGYANRAGAFLDRESARVLIWSGSVPIAHLFDVRTGKVLMKFAHDDLLSGATFSPDESNMLTWSSDGTARVWRVSDGAILAVFQHRGTDPSGNPFEINGAVFGRDNSEVLTSSVDGLARLWNTGCVAPVRLFRHSAPLHGTNYRESDLSGAFFVNNGSQVVSWSLDGTARFWDVSVEEATPTVQRIRDWTLRSGTTMSDSGQYRTLTYSEWLDLKRQLDARPAAVTPPAQR